MADRLLLRGGTVLTVDSDLGDLPRGDVLIEGDASVIDPVAAVTLSVDVPNVDTVLVDGQVKKRDGMLVGDVERALRLHEASRDYLVQQAEQAQQA